tara:strand:- start:4576 stop:4701 length:126 start_codon:yes stop_codon:yes gene_type:complete
MAGRKKGSAMGGNKKGSAMGGNSTNNMKRKMAKVRTRRKKA